jgi:hypothetical protein
LVILFGAVRFAGLFNDLWLDELWSLALVGQLHSPAEVLTRLWHDNNHPLNSLFLYWLNPAKADWHYRLLSWFTGTAAIGFAGLIARRLFVLLHPGASPGQAPAAGIITATLVGGSYFLVHYSSEARGYAPAVGFCFLAIYALLRDTGKPASAWAVVYGLGCGFGLLAHLVTFQVMLAGLVWSAARALPSWRRWREHLVHFACWHLVPWAMLALYYFGFVRKVQIGGGPVLALSDVLGSLAAYTLGLPSGAGAAVALPILLGVILVGLGLVWFRSRAWFVFFVTAIVVAPAVGLISSRFVLLYSRYFIVSAAVGLLLAGYVLTRLWFAGRAASFAGAVALTAFLAGNGAHTRHLLRDGRGLYQAALRHIAARTPSALITVASDSDFRNSGVIGYYAKAVGPGHTLQYYPADQLPPEGPQWIFLHRLDGGPPPPAPDLNVGAGWHFRLDGVFPHGPLSGWTWYVFRNLDPQVLPPAAR